MCRIQKCHSLRRPLVNEKSAKNLLGSRAVCSLVGSIRSSSQCCGAARHAREPGWAHQVVRLRKPGRRIARMLSLPTRVA